MTNGLAQARGTASAVARPGWSLGNRHEAERRDGWQLEPIPSAGLPRRIGDKRLLQPLPRLFIDLHHSKLTFHSTPPWIQ